MDKKQPAEQQATCTNSDSWNCKYCNKTKTCAALAAGQATAAQAAQVGAVESNTADAAPTQGATEMENLQRTAVGWQGRALRAERNWAVCRRWAIAGGAPVEKLGDDPDQPFHAASPAIDAARKQGGL